MDLVLCLGQDFGPSGKVRVGDFGFCAINSWRYLSGQYQVRQQYNIILG